MGGAAHLFLAGVAVGIADQFTLAFLGVGACVPCSEIAAIGRVFTVACEKAGGEERPQKPHAQGINLEFRRVHAASLGAG
jgi:hypothetical protein